jgi:hypothetical protein
MLVFIVMNLISTDGVKLNFKIIGYEFPEIQNGLDSNWLYLNIKIQGEGIFLNETDPSLQTTELNRLNRWFIRMMLGKLKKGETWSPLENTFTFEFIKKEGVTLYFKFHPHQMFSLKELFSLEFMVGEKELSKQILNLRKYERLFPTRDHQEHL